MSSGEVLLSINFVTQQPTSSFYFFQLNNGNRVYQKLQKHKLTNLDMQQVISPPLIKFVIIFTGFQVFLKLAKK